MASYFASILPNIEGGYSVLFFDFPEAITHGETLEEAIEMAEDALSVTCEEYVRERRTIPKPTPIQEIQEKTLARIEETKEFFDLSQVPLYQLIKLPNMDLKPVRITITIAKNILEQIDKKAHTLGMTRSGLLAQSALVYEG